MYFLHSVLFLSFLLFSLCFCLDITDSFVFEITNSVFSCIQATVSTFSFSLKYWVL